MNLVVRALYRTVIFTIKVYQRLFLDLHVWGRENIPEGPKIYVANHISATDSCWVLPVLPGMVHMVHGAGFETWWIRRILQTFEQINGQAGHSKIMISTAVEYLRLGESVGITPEGDLHDPFTLGPFHAGVAAIYRRMPVPIVPMALLAPKSAMRPHRFAVTVDGRRSHRTISYVFRGPFCINIGEPCLPEIPEGSRSEQNEHIVQCIRGRIEALIHDVRISKFWM